MRIIGNAIVGFVVAAAVFGAEERSAAAGDIDSSDWDFHFHFGPEYPVALLGFGLTATAGTVFFAAEAYYGSSGRSLPPGWAWPQLLVAGIPIAASGIFVGAEAEDKSFVPVGFVLASVGAWFIGDSIYSLHAYGERAGRPGAGGWSPIAVGVVPTRQSVVGMAAFRL